MSTTDERFWAKVEKTQDCWLWLGAPSKARGYGRIHVGTSRDNSKVVYAHRYSWVIHHGEIAPGLVVCHRCDERLCVRPEHLFLGTVADNQRDMKNKGRAPRGTQQPHSVLTPEVVLRARERQSQGELMTEIAKDLGYKYETIRQAITGRNWAWL